MTQPLTVEALPWQRHPLDFTGRLATFIGPNGHHISVSNNKYTKRLFSLSVTEPGLKPSDHRRHTYMTGGEFRMWLSRLHQEDLEAAV